MLSCFNHVQLLVTPWTIAHQASLSMGFSKQEYWSELPCPTPGDLPDPGIKPMSLISPALAGRFFTSSTTLGAHFPLHAKIYLQKLYIFKQVPHWLFPSFSAEAIINFNYIWQLNRNLNKSCFLKLNYKWRKINWQCVMYLTWSVSISYSTMRSLPVEK